MDTLSKNEKDLLCGYRDKGNKKINTKLWSKSSQMDEQVDERKDLQTARWTETKLIYSWNTLYAICMI